MQVRDIMTTDVVTAEIDASLQVVVARMSENRAGSVIITSEGTPAGMITETDALRAGYRTERPFTKIPAQEVMTRPVKTIAPDATVRRAGEKMDEHDVKKLPVMDGIELVGIITLTDIVQHVSDRSGDHSPIDGDHFSDPVE